MRIPALDEHGHEAEGEPVLIERLRHRVPGDRRGPHRRDRADARAVRARVALDEDDRSRASRRAPPPSVAERRYPRVERRLPVRRAPTAGARAPARPCNGAGDEIERHPHQHRPERTAIGHVMPRPAQRRRYGRYSGSDALHVERVGRRRARADTESRTSRRPRPCPGTRRAWRRSRRRAASIADGRPSDRPRSAKRRRGAGAV